MHLAASTIPGEHLLPDIHVRVAIGDSASVLAQVGRVEIALGPVGRKAESPALESCYPRPRAWWGG